MHNTATRMVLSSLIIGLVLSVLSGCTPTLGLATTGPIEQLSNPGKGSSRVYVDPKGPEPNAKPEEVIRGFLLALPAGPQSDGFNTAREFLTAHTATTWNPESAVTVYAGEPRIDVQANQFSNGNGGVRVRVTFEQIGRVDNHGVYRANDAINSSVEDFQLNLVDGQWRINVLSNGVLISESDFAQTYREVQLYMPDNALATMIPDTRWFSWNGWRTSAVQELLRGPVDYLSKSVYPVSTRKNIQLDLDSVTLDGTTAQVKLTNALASLSKKQLALLVHQIRLTLNDGNNKGPLRVVDDSGADISNSDSALQMRVVELPTHFYSLTQEAIVSVRNTSLNLLRVGVTPKILQGIQADDTSKQSFRFVFNEYGGMALDQHGLPVCFDASVQQISCSPQWNNVSLRGIFSGPHNEIWAITQNNDVVVFASHPVREEDTPHAMQQGDMKVFHPAWDVAGTVSALNIAPEGARIVATVHREQGDDIALIAGIVRDEQGNVTDISQSSVRLLRSENIRDVAFFNDTTLVLALSQDDVGCVAQATGPCVSSDIPINTRQLVGVQLHNTQAMVALSDSGVVSYITSSLQGTWRQLDSQTLAICAGQVT